MSNDGDTYQDVSVLLGEIVKYFHEPSRGVAAACRIVAAQLCGQVKPRPRWGWQYVHLVWHRKMNPSRRLSCAICRLHKKIKKLPAPVDFIPVSVYSLSGFIEPETVVTARTKHCEWSNCGRPFLPNSPNQKYCSTNCRKSASRVRSSRTKR